MYQRDAPAVWRPRDLLTIDESVVNATKHLNPMVPVSPAPAEASRVGWAARLPGQPVPLIGERRPL